MGDIMARKRYYASKKIMILSLLGILFLLASALGENEHYYKMTLVNSDNDISLKNIEVIPTNKDIEMFGSNYVMELISFSNEELDVVFFDFPSIVFYDNIDPQTKEIIGGGILMLNHTELDVYVKYFDNAKEINIYDLEYNKVLTIDVSKYSKSDYFIEKEMMIKNEIPSEDEKNDDDELLDDNKLKPKEEDNIFLIIWIILGVLLLIVIFLIIFVKITKR